MIVLDFYLFFIPGIRMSRACCLKLTCFSLLFIQLKLAFTLDHETGLPQGCHIYEYRDSNK